MVDKVLTRIAKKAGSWYEANAVVLSEELKDYLDYASKQLKNYDTNIKTLKAIIVPHAGYTYSGPTAGYSYFRLSNEKTLKSINTIFVLGPSHYTYFKGCKVTQCSLIQTPFGNLEVNTEITKNLAEQTNFSVLPKDVDEKEHSLEMQFPFIYQSTYANGYKPKIVSIMVGETNPDTALSIGKVLLPYFERDDVSFIISSDFCHWGNNFDYMPYSGTGPIHEYIEKLDKEGINYILNKDLEGFYNYLETTQNTICGRNPIMILLSIIKLQKKYNIEGHKLAYAQSGKVKSNKESSVSYCSIAFEGTL